MKSNHTPGPWAQSGCGRIVSSSGETIRCHGIALAMYDSEEVEANTRLISAAPELLDACQKLMHGVSLIKAGSDKSNLDFGIDLMLEFFAKASAAIAKATGGDHG